MSQLASPVPSQLGGLTWQKVILGDWSRVIRGIRSTSAAYFSWPPRSSGPSPVTP